MIKSLLSLALIIFAFNAHADIRELIDEDVLKQIAEETSGEAAKRNDAAHTFPTQELRA
jgi:hypothetical protein